MRQPDSVFAATKPGPYAVGVTNVVFIDEHRLDPVTENPRVLVTEIWYPTSEDTSSLPKNRYVDFLPLEVIDKLDEFFYIPGPKPYQVSLEFLENRFRNEAVRDVAVAPGKFPLILFSHSTNGTRYQNTVWCEHVASHGFVVVAPDHTGNARFSFVNGQIIPYLSKQNQNSIYDRPKDLMFLLDQLDGWNKGVEGRFAGRLDLDAVGSAGHSFGSATAIASATVEPRIKAVVGMACAYWSLPPNPTVPTLHMLAVEDGFIGTGGNEIIRWHQSFHTGPSFLLELTNGGHLSFTDNLMLCDQPHEGIGPGARWDTGAPFVYTPKDTAYAIINSYSVAFLCCYLKGQTDYLRFLQDNHWPAEMTWEAKGIKGLREKDPETLAGRAQAESF